MSLPASVLQRFRRKPGTPLGARAFDLLCLSAAVVIAAHAAHLPVWLTAALAVVLAVRWRQRRRFEGRAPWYLKLPLLALLSAAVILYYGNLFGREPGAALATGLLVLKLLETANSRDARVVAAFACFTLMAALLFDQSMVMTVLVALGLLPALAALRALEPGQPRTSLPRELLPALTLLGASLPVALLAFVLVPRLNQPLWGTGRQDQGRTGLSTTMSPGDLIDLLTDDHPAMRVSFDTEPPPVEQRYFRAWVMSHYDGREWSDTHPLLQAIPINNISAITSYTVTLEPSGQNILPALDMPIDVAEHARLGDRGEMLAEQPVNEQRVYHLHSALGYHLQAQLDDRERQHNLQLPRGFNPRTLALAQQWRQAYGNDDGAIVRTALTRFRNGGFSYTLVPPPLGHNAMDDFLFNTRAGFCEHYASAFTVLMRAAGIPARVVTGYQGGFWNTMGNYLLVRQSDAHAWSEVWLAGRGWVRVDPTAAVRPDRVSRGAAAAATGPSAAIAPGGWWLDMRNRWDVVNRWWNQGVIGFDELRQQGLLTPFGIRQTDTRLLGGLLVLGASLFAAIGLAWALWNRPPADPLRTAMQRLERKLAAAGIVRQPSEGPRHYLIRAGQAMPAQRAELDRLMQLYLELRYAHDVPPETPFKVFRQLVRDFRAQRMVK